MERFIEWTENNTFLCTATHMHAAHTAGWKSPQEVVRPATETDYIID